MSVAIEILYYEGCPNVQQTTRLVQRIVSELYFDADIYLVEVRDAEDAIARRFLGSPTVRVDGEDVEPGAGRRRGYGLATRVYRTEEGLSARPEEAWIRAALAQRW